MDQTLSNPPLPFFFKQRVFNLKWQRKTFLLMPDITSYLTAAGAYQTRDLVLKLAPTSAFFFFFFNFFFQWSHKKIVTAPTPRVFLFTLEGFFLYQWAASGTPWGWWGGGGGGGDSKVFFFLVCFLQNHCATGTRHAVLQCGLGVCMRQTACRGLQKASKGIIYQREILFPDEYQVTWYETRAIDVLPAEKGKLSFACFCNFMRNSRRQIRFFSPPQLSGSSDWVLMQEGYALPLLIYLYCHSKLLCLYFYNLKAQCVRFSTL